MPEDVCRQGSMSAHSTVVHRVMHRDIDVSVEHACSNPRNQLYATEKISRGFLLVGDCCGSDS